jgi:hypothetical protein
MPFLLNNPGHWHLRAQEARLLASKLEDPEAEATILKIAEEYERLAVRSAKRLAEQKQPDNRSPTQARNPVPGSVLIPNLLS